MSQLPADVLSAVIGFGAGWLVVLLVLRPDARIWSLVLPPTVALLAAAGIGATTGTLVGSLVGAIAGVLLGYTAAAYTLIREPDRTASRVAPAPEERKIAVVYFTHGEPAAYEPEPWVNMLYELDDTVPSFPPKFVWPFILLGIKRSFSVVKESPHCAIHGRTMEAVAQRVGRDDVAWYVSFLDADPALRDVVAQAAADGATDIVFLTVFLTDSDHTAEADEMDEAMGLSEAGIRTVRTPVLWNDPRLARMIASKIDRATEGLEHGEVGVMLVGHGQPAEWDLTHPTETEQEQAFRAAIRAVLIEEGYPADLISEGWMSFREPRVPDQVRTLVRNGARTVVSVPVTISADSLHSLHDTPGLVRKGARGLDVDIVEVGGWNTEELLVEILADRTREALDALDAAEDATPDAVTSAAGETEVVAG